MIRRFAVRLFAPLITALAMIFGALAVGCASNGTLTTQQSAIVNNAFSTADFTFTTAIDGAEFVLPIIYSQGKMSSNTYIQLATDLQSAIDSLYAFRYGYTTAIADGGITAGNWQKIAGVALNVYVKDVKGAGSTAQFPMNQTPPVSLPVLLPMGQLPAGYVPPPLPPAITPATAP